MFTIHTFFNSSLLDSKHLVVSFAQLAQQLQFILLQNLIEVCIEFICSLFRNPITSLLFFDNFKNLLFMWQYLKKLNHQTFARKIYFYNQIPFSLH